METLRSSEVKTVLSFDALDRDSLPVAGGKAANLGELTRAGVSQSLKVSASPRRRMPPLRTTSISPPPWTRWKVRPRTTRSTCRASLPR